MVEFELGQCKESITRREPQSVDRITIQVLSTGHLNFDSIINFVNIREVYNYISINDETFP